MANHSYEIAGLKTHMHGYGHSKTCQESRDLKKKFKNKLHLDLYEDSCARLDRVCITKAENSH
jgi:hypothetical protein